MCTDDHRTRRRAVHRSRRCRRSLRSPAHPARPGTVRKGTIVELSRSCTYVSGERRRRHRRLVGRRRGHPALRGHGPPRHRDPRDAGCDDDSARIVTSRAVDVGCRASPARCCRPPNTMVQTDEWRRDGDGWTGEFRAEVAGAPVEMSGTMSLEPDGSGTRAHGDDADEGQGAARRREDRRLGRQERHPRTLQAEFDATTTGSPATADRTITLSATRHADSRQLEYRQCRDLSPETGVEGWLSSPRRWAAGRWLHEGIRRARRCR